MLLNAVSRRNWSRKWPCKGSSWAMASPPQAKKGWRCQDLSYPQGQHCSLTHMPPLGPHTAHLRKGSNFQKGKDLAKLFSIILCCVIDTKLFRKFTELPTKSFFFFFHLKIIWMSSIRRVGNFQLIQHNLWGPDTGLVLWTQDAWVRRAPHLCTSN